MYANNVNQSKSTYFHLRPQVINNSNYYDRHRKKSYPYKKFQTGSTTTFSGYTNINVNEHNQNYLHQGNARNSNVTYSKFRNNNYNDIPRNVNRYPSLMNNDNYQQPPRKNRRSLKQAEEYKYRTSLMNYQLQDHQKNENDYINKRNLLSSIKFNGLILSDSMCKYVRPDQVSSNDIQVKLSFESGCDCIRMRNFLEKKILIIV